jgi:hypothetical protein
MSHFSALAPASSRTRCMRDVAGGWLAFLVLTIAAERLEPSTCDALKTTYISVAGR